MLHASAPGDRLTIHIESRERGERVFDATLSLTRRPAREPRPAATALPRADAARARLDLWPRGGARPARRPLPPAPRSEACHDPPQSPSSPTPPSAWPTRWVCSQRRLGSLGLSVGGCTCRRPAAEVALRGLGMRWIWRWRPALTSRSAGVGHARALVARRLRRRRYRRPRRHRGRGRRGPAPARKVGHGRCGRRLWRCRGRLSPPGRLMDEVSPGRPSSSPVPAGASARRWWTS